MERVRSKLRRSTVNQDVRYLRDHPVRIITRAGGASSDEVVRTIESKAVWVLRKTEDTLLIAGRCSPPEGWVIGGRFSSMILCPNGVHMLRGKDPPCVQLGVDGWTHGAHPAQRWVWDYLRHLEVKGPCCEALRSLRNVRSEYLNHRLDLLAYREFKTNGMYRLISETGMFRYEVDEWKDVASLDTSYNLFNYIAGLSFALQS